MKFLAIVLAVPLVLWPSPWAVREAAQSRFDPLPIEFYEVELGDIATVFDQLRRTGRNESFGIFKFFPSDSLLGPHVELQFSIEGGRIGFDWVMLGEVKERDLEKFLIHAQRLGHEVRRLEGNRVRYLRVEDGDLVGLCTSIMTSFYGVWAGTWIELIATGFEVEGFPLSTD